MGVSATLPPPGSKVATALGGTQVRFDGIDAPLLYARGRPGERCSAVRSGLGHQHGPDGRVRWQSVHGRHVAGGSIHARVVHCPDDSGHGQGAIINQDGTVNSARRTRHRRGVSFPYSVLAAGRPLRHPATARSLRRCQTTWYWSRPPPWAGNLLKCSMQAGRQPFWRASCRSTSRSRAARPRARRRW